MLIAKGDKGMFNLFCFIAIVIIEIAQVYWYRTNIKWSYDEGYEKGIKDGYNKGLYLNVVKRSSED